MAKFFYPLLLQLRMAGVPVAESEAQWKRAHVGDDGVIYKALLDGAGYRLQSSNIVVNRDDENPKVLNLVAGDDAVGRRQLKPFLDPSRFRLLSMERRLVDPREFKLDWGFNPDLKLTALKMAVAIVSIALPVELPGLAQPRGELTRADLRVHPVSVAADLRDHSALDAMRGDLCHVAYVEQLGGLIHAFVQFFGSIQFWVSLTHRASVSRSCALLAKLDPVTGEESFLEMIPLQLPPFRDAWVDARAPIRKLNASAVKRGSKVAEMIKINEVRVDGVPVNLRKPYWVTSWTGDVPKKTSS